MQASTRFMLSAIAHGVLLSKMTLTDDGHLPKRVQARVLFAKGRAAIATHTDVDAHTPDHVEERARLSSLVERLKKRKGAEKAPRSFRDCLRLVEPHHPLLNDDITWEAEGTTGSHPPLSTSIPQQKPSICTQPTSSAACDSKEGSLQTVPDWLNHGKQVTLTGLLKYIQRVGSAEDGDSAEIWRHIAHGRVFSKHLCDGVHGKCDCGFEHKNRTCVQVAIEEIVDGIGTVSSCPEEGDISAANAAMAKVYKRTLAVGGRVWWPAGMTCERVVEVQVKKEKKVQVKKEKRQVAVREPERPTITTKSGRNCNPA